MTREGGAPAPRRWSLRLRLGALCAGLGLAPFALAILLLYPVSRQEAMREQGESLVREALLLSEHVSARLGGFKDFRLAYGVVDSFRRGTNGRALLLASDGSIVAGRAGVPAPPPPLSASGAHWFAFENQGTEYLAAVAPLGTAATATSPSAARLLAVVQPLDEVLAPMRARVLRLAPILLGFAAFAVIVSWRLTGRFLQPLRQLQQGAELISRINLAHRLDVRTGDELQDLAEEFNRMAESLQGAYGELEERIRGTTRNLREERNRLAAVLRTMAEGVVMTNEAGEVVLATPSARLALGAKASSVVGVSLAWLLPPDRLEFHLRRVRRVWDEGREAAENVVFPLAGGRTLRGVISAVPGPARERSGFLFVFRDLGAQSEEHRADSALRQVPELLKGPAVTLLSLTEVLAARPNMEEAKRREFLSGIHQEALRLTDRLKGVEEAAAQAHTALWPLSACDPRELLAEALADMPGAPLCIDIDEDAPVSVLVEPYSWVSALATVVGWIRARSPGLPFEARLSAEEEAVVTTFRVEGPFPGDPQDVYALRLAPVGEEVVPLAEAVRRNRGEFWCRRVAGALEVGLALLGQAGQSRREQRGIADEQPEFYDFDLFLPRPAADRGDLLTMPLAALEYVVFDTETTGLNPSDGDEVVSLSAVRIRNGKIVGADVFHTLVNPGRHIPFESTRFHGVTDDSVVDAPTMAEVLPHFREYAGDAVLVAHNAAFDKKFLDLAAAKHGLDPVENTILDTLFLSYGVHREFEGHNLDSIAARLGVEVSGRHTSLGDARGTAEIFLKLLPLLSTRGVATLADAKAFCDRMLLFRWQTSRF